MNMKTAIETKDSAHKKFKMDALIPNALDAVEHSIDALDAFKHLQEWAQSQKALNAPADQVEQAILHGGMEIQRRLLEENIKSRGHGEVGKAIVVETEEEDDDEYNNDYNNNNLHRLWRRQNHKCDYESIFGTLKIHRLGYGAPGFDSIHPLDEDLNLPHRRYSYPVQKRATLLAGRGPFDEAVDEIERTTGAHLPKRQLELIVSEAAEDFESFYEQRSGHPEEEDKNDTLLVTSLDCKGIPRRKTAEELAEIQPLRINPGEKRTKKKMATVATVHTSRPYYRTAEDIVEKLIDGTTKTENKSDSTKTPPPRFKNRRLWASIKKSKDEVFTEVVEEMERRDDINKKQAICVMDGERALHRRAANILTEKFPKIIIILDIIHVLDYLWEAGFAFHPNCREDAKEWVRERFLSILEGQVSLVVSGMRQSATKRELDEKPREAVDRTCNYFLNNKKAMRYDEYLKQGFPIASGSAEGACCHLVKDRMELTGAIWDVEESRAEAVLKIRALDKSGDFEDYWDFHMNQEYLRKYNDDWKVAA